MRVGGVVSKLLHIFVTCLIVGSVLGWFPTSVSASSRTQVLGTLIDSSSSQTRANVASPIASQRVFSPAAGTWEVTGTIQLSGTERPLQIEISGGKAYVSRNPGHLTVVDLSTNMVVTTISFDPYPGAAPHYIGILGEKAYVALGNLGSDGQLAVINIANNTVAGYIPVGADPYGVATFGQKIYVTNNVWWSSGDPATVKVVDANTNSVVATIPVGINPTSIAVDPVSRKAYVTNHNDLSKSVSVIDTNTNSVTATISINNPPAGVAISGTRAYISTTVNMPNGTAEVIDIGTDSVVSSVPVGRDSWGIAASDGHIFVANQSSSTVSVIEVATNSVVATVGVGDDPTHIAVDPSTNRVYVSNQGDNTISIIEPRAVSQPTIAYHPSRFTFTAIQGGPNPTTQSFEIWNAGSGTLDWSVSDDAAWLSLIPTSGTSTGETDDVGVSVSISGMGTSNYSATITISASGATNTPQTLAVSLTINPSQETISTPNNPTGPSDGQVNQSLAYSTGGASSSLGHGLEYRFDWGDGDYSNWSPSTTISHSWSNPRTYTVRAQVRCATHTDIFSEWSSGTSVTINVPQETISAPSVITGPSNGEVGQRLTFSTGGAASSLGHSLEYQFDWGDGSYSDWSSSTETSYSWSTPSTYTVRAQARCATHTDISSTWSPKLVLDIKATAVASTKIDSHSATPKEVVVGNPVALSFTFTNTGNSPWTFYAAASLRKPNGAQVHLPLKAASLNPGMSGSASWTYTITDEGDWDVVFGLWKEREQVNSLGHTGWLGGYVVGTLAPPKLFITSPLVIVPKKDTYSVGETITAKFTITNRGGAPITLKTLTVGGRDPNDQVSDFDWHENVTLAADSSYDYQGNITLSKLGNYHFFCTYQTPDGSWNTSVDLSQGLTDEDRIEDIAVILGEVLKRPPAKDRGGIVIPKEIFPEGRGAMIPIYVREVEDGSNALREDNNWRAVKEINKARVDFDWTKFAAAWRVQAPGMEFPQAASFVVAGALISAVNEAISAVTLRITVQKHSEQGLRAIIEMGDPNGTSFVRNYAGDGGVDVTATVFWTYRAAFSKLLEDTFRLEPSGEFSYYTIVLQMDRSHKDDEYISYISFSPDNKIILTPKVYPDDQLRIVRIREVVIPYKAETIIEVTGDGFISLTESTLDDISSKTIMRMLTPMFLAADSAISIQVKSPCELRVYDSRGRLTGWKNGEIREEIPDSICNHDTKIVVILSPSDSYRYEVVGTKEGTYGLVGISTDKGETTTFRLDEVPISTKSVHEYNIDWNAISRGQKGATMKIDADGDGEFEQEIRLSGVERSELPAWAWLLIGMAVAIIAFVTVRVIIARKK